MDGEITTEDELKAAIRKLLGETDQAKGGFDKAVADSVKLNTVTRVDPAGGTGEHAIEVRTCDTKIGATVKYVPSADFAAQKYGVVEGTGGYDSTVNFTGAVSVKSTDDKVEAESSQLVILWPRGACGESGQDFKPREKSHPEYKTKYTGRDTVKYEFSTAGVSVTPMKAVSASVTGCSISGNAATVSVTGFSNSVCGYYLTLTGVGLDLGGTSYCLSANANKLKAVLGAMFPLTAVKTLHSNSFSAVNARA